LFRKIDYMDFMNIILELASREDLKAWDMEQRSILLKLIDRHILNKTDPKFVDQVMTFAKFFADYFATHGETPSVKESEKFMKAR
jgi:hypothetical protein